MWIAATGSAPLDDPFLEILGVAVALALVVGALELVAASFRPSARGWSAVAAGLALLVAGILLGPMGSGELPTSGVYRSDFTCYVAAALFLSIGLILRLARTSGRAYVERLNDTLARTDRELSSIHALLHSLVRSSISGIMILQAIRDDDDFIVDLECRLMNEEAEQLLGRSARELVGEPLLRHLPCIREEGLLKEAISVIETKLPFRDERRCHHGGASRWYQIAAVKHGDGIVATFADVSDRKRTEDKLRHAAQHDTLTGTPNRSLFTARLEQAIKRAKRQPNYKFAVLFLDVDRFKAINDSLGHEVGDQLLISISDRLRSNLRGMDTATRIDEGHLPARLGGDEFAVLLDGIQDIRDAERVAGRIQKELSAPHQVGGHQVVSTISIGIVTSDAGYDRPDEILRDADTAMYQAKKGGKARHVVFDEKMHSNALERLRLEKELRQAAEQDQFRLVYQPIVSLPDASLMGFEALIRWSHPKRGIILPASFIGLAEEIGIIVPIGRWVIREACQQLRQWQRRRPELVMSVNLSKQQLFHADFLSSLKRFLKESRTRPQSLMLEITETTVMERADSMTPVLEKLRDMGVRLAMDDFGTGHSSLSLLHRMPVQVLKIDRSFVSGAASQTESPAMVRTIVQLAANLEMDVIAEGIETPEQLAMLQSLRCRYGQGFLFGEPLEPSAAQELLAGDYRFTVAA